MRLQCHINQGHGLHKSVNSQVCLYDKLIGKIKPVRGI